MIQEKISLWTNAEYNYPMAFGFIPNMHFYLHDDEQRRPCVIILPGGGYRFVSPAEGEIVAKRFYSLGFQTAVLTYTVNVLMNAPVIDQALRDASRGVRILRRRAKELRILSNRIILLGFSAAGHVAASLGIYANAIAPDDLYTDFDKVLANNEMPNGKMMADDCQKEGADNAWPASNRPDALVLCYPVITSGPLAHRGSIDCLVGVDASSEDLDRWSLEKHIHRGFPPSFIWSVMTDEAVPVENSLFLAQGLREAGARCALHLFSTGSHGLSLADETWASCRYGKPYTLEQTFAAIEALKLGKIGMKLDEKLVKDTIEEFRPGGTREQRHIGRASNREVCVWPDLVAEWIRGLR